MYRVSHAALVRSPSREYRDAVVRALSVPDCAVTSGTQRLRRKQDQVLISCRHATSGSASASHSSSAAGDRSRR
jgi:hypothetical protein